MGETKRSVQKPTLRKMRSKAPVSVPDRAQLRNRMTDRLTLARAFKSVGLPTEAAERLGLSGNGLYKQLHDEWKASCQTEIILDLEEAQRLKRKLRQRVAA